MAIIMFENISPAYMETEVREPTAAFEQTQPTIEFEQLQPTMGFEVIN